MSFATPFFHAFNSLLFGKPPVSGLKKAMAALPKITSLAELRHLFGSYIPAALLARTPCGDNSRQRIFSLEVIFWAFLDQGLTPFGLLILRSILIELGALYRVMTPGHLPRFIAQTPHRLLDMRTPATWAASRSNGRMPRTIED